MAFLVVAGEATPPQGSISNGLSVDSAGNAVMAGYFEGSVDFDPGPGNTGKSTIHAHTYFLARHDDDGALDWVVSTDPSNSDVVTVGRDVAVNATGDIYVTGLAHRADGGGTSFDLDEGPGTVSFAFDGPSFAMFVARYDADGAIDWVAGGRSVGGLGILGESVAAIGTDVVVAGRYIGLMDLDGTGGADLPNATGYFIARYDSAGNFESANAIVGAWFEFLGPSIAPAPAGGVYIGGGFTGTADFDPAGPGGLVSETDEKAAVLGRYDAAGSLVWAIASQQSIVTGAATIADIAVDGAGNVFVVGGVEGSVDLDPGTGVASVGGLDGLVHFLAKYDSSGALQWAETIPLPFSVSLSLGDFAQEFGPAVAVDGGGNVLLAANLIAAIGTFDVDPGAGTALVSSEAVATQVLAKYDSNGTFLWATATSGDSGQAGSTDVDAGPSDNVWLTGALAGTVDFAGGDVETQIVRPGTGFHFLALYGSEGTLGGEPADTIAPGAASVLAIDEDTGTPDDRITTDRTLTVSGLAEPLSTVHVFRDGSAIGDTVAGATGEWSFVDTDTLAFGPHQYRAQAEDAASNLGPLSPPLQVLIVDPGALPTAGSDAVMGNAGANQIQGGEGNDTVLGEGGNDTVRGNNGNDSLFGGEGNDRAEGGNGADTAYGEAGNDSLYGENGNDRLLGGNGSDRLEGGAGMDSLEGGAGADTMYGGADTDSLLGGTGGDLLFGDAGGDWIDPGVDTVHDTVRGTVAHLSDDTIDGFFAGSPTSPAADMLLITGLTNAQAKKLDGDLLDGAGGLSLAEVGGGTITFLGHGGATVDAIFTANGVQIWLAEIF